MGDLASQGIRNHSESHNASVHQRDESGAAWDESGTSWDESGAGWDESAATACGSDFNTTAFTRATDRVTRCSDCDVGQHTSSHERLPESRRRGRLPPRPTMKRPAS